MEITLSAVAKRRAIEAIDEVAKGFPAFKEASDNFHTATLGLSDHIFGLSKYAMKESKSPKDAAALFAAMCTYAENTFRERLQASGESTSLKDSLPVWSTFKSKILRGMRLGLKPTDYKNEYGMQKAVREIMKTQEKPTRPANIAGVDDFLGRTTIVPRLAVWVSRLTLEAEYIKPSKLTEAEALYREFVERLAPLIDQKRIQDDATRDALITEVEKEDVRSDIDKRGRGRDRPRARANPGALREGGDKDPRSANDS